MPYVLRMTPPRGAPEYLPPGFGYTAHEHARAITQAARFDTPQDAMRRGNAYRWPPAFWNSEREHRDRMARRFRGWTFEAVEVTA